MTRARDNAAVGEEFASGTKMIFNQTAAPTGWTKVTGSGNDHALKLTTGTVGTGGSVDFETALASHTPTASGGAVASHTLTTAEMPSHNHEIHAYDHTCNALFNAKIYVWSGTCWSTTRTGFNRATTNSAWSGENLFADSKDKSSNAQGGDPHTHSFSQPTISALNLDVKYVDVIIATKD